MERRLYRVTLVDPTGGQREWLEIRTGSDEEAITQAAALRPGWTVQGAEPRWTPAAERAA